MMLRFARGPDTRDPDHTASLHQRLPASHIALYAELQRHPESHSLALRYRARCVAARNIRPSSPDIALRRQRIEQPCVVRGAVRRLASERYAERGRVAPCGS
jgi:hypothetical protein